MHPVVLRILAKMADEFGIREVRLPSEELGITLGLDRSNLVEKLVWARLFHYLRRYGERYLEAARIGYMDRVYGLLASSRIAEEYLLGLIPQIRADRVEVYSHPAIEIIGEPLNGPVGSGEAELAALLSHRVRDKLVSNGFTPATSCDAQSTRSS